MSTVQLPVIYDPSATCPNWDKFIADTFPTDARVVAYEVVAWLIVPCPEIQKALLLLGEGCNGKSTYLKGLIAFLGPDNVSTVSLHKLESDRFATSRLLGKSANICPDLPNKRLESTSIFKAITGGDAVMGEHKFRDSFDFRPFAKLLFSANELPRSADTSDGFYRRLMVVPFGVKFLAFRWVLRKSIFEQLIEACKDVDANDLDIEKSGILAELVAEVAHRNGLDRLQHDGRA